MKNKNIQIIFIVIFLVSSFVAYFTLDVVKENKINTLSEKLDQYSISYAKNINLEKTMPIKEKDFLINEILLTHNIILLTCIFLILLTCLIFYYEIKAKKQLKTTNEKLEIALNKFQHVFNYSLAGFLVTDDKRKIIDLNPTALKMAGYDDSSELIGKDSRILHISDESFERYAELVISKAKENKLMNDKIGIKYQFAKKDGSTIWCEILGSPLCEDAKLPQGGILWTVIDINEKVLAEETIKMQNDKLQELNKNLNSEVEKQIASLREKDNILIQQSKLASMGEMMDAVAHQWKQPLNIIKMSSSEIDLMFDMNDMDKAYLPKISKRISKQISYMVETLDEFRSFFRPKIQYDEISIKKLIDSSLVLMKDELVKHTIVTKFFGDENINLKVIPNEFKHVIINIVNNAKDEFIKKEIKDRLISFNVSKDELFIILKIQDNAGGIQKDILNDIFKANVTTKTKEEGSGIGLYMSKIIIEKTGGTIEAKNINDGALFTLRMPI